MTQKEAVVKQVVMASNKLQSTVRFEMDPEEFASAFFEAEKEGIDLIGLFHSHPAPAKPSSIDLEGMRLWKDVIWLIFSSISGKLAGYQMKNDKVVEVAIEVEP
jgi:proteasome lid subunit RPN8/RPN11